MVKPQLRGGLTGGWEGRNGSGGALRRPGGQARGKMGVGQPRRRRAEGGGMTRRPCGLCRLETVRGRGSCFCLMTARGTSHPPREGSGRPGLPDTSQVNDQPRPCSLRMRGQLPRKGRQPGWNQPGSSSEAFLLLSSPSSPPEKGLGPLEADLAEDWRWAGTDPSSRPRSPGHLRLS